jgi:hypothetical protein
MEGLSMEDVGLFYCPFWSILRPFWYILWPFGIFYGHLVYFSRFGMLYQVNSGNPVSNLHFLFVASYRKRLKEEKPKKCSFLKK